MSQFSLNQCGLCVTILLDDESEQIHFYSPTQWLANDNLSPKWHCNVINVIEKHIWRKEMLFLPGGKPSYWVGAETCTRKEKWGELLTDFWDENYDFTYWIEGLKVARIWNSVKRPVGIRKEGVCAWWVEENPHLHRLVSWRTVTEKDEEKNLLLELLLSY